MADANPDFEAEVKVAYPTMVRFATVLCWSSADVEEMVQETVLRAFRSYPSFRGEATFLTWACAILARVAADANRRRARAE